MAVIPTDAIQDPSPQLQAVLRWLDAFIITLDVIALETDITEDYTHPKSLGRPALRKADFWVCRHILDACGAKLQGY